MNSLLNQIIIAYYSIEDDESYTYISINDGKDFRNLDGAIAIPSFIARMIDNLYKLFKDNKYESYFKIKESESCKRIFECKHSVKTEDGIYSFTTFSNCDIIAMEENQEKLKELMNIHIDFR